MDYKPENICVSNISLDVDEEGRVHNVKFTGGCVANLVGIADLVEGMKKEDVIARLEGIMCKDRGTSCPDQLVQILKKL